MSSGTKLYRGLFGCALVVLICLVMAQRHEGISANQEREKLTAHIESIASELATLKAQLDQRPQENATLQKTLDLAGISRRLAYLEAQQSNITTHIQNLDSRIQPSIPHDTAVQGQQQAVAELKTQSNAQEQKAARTTAKLEEWRKSLNIPDEIVVLDASVALKTPELVNYWPYFEAKKESEEAFDLARLLKRKLQIEEVDLAVEAARGNGITK